MKNAFIFLVAAITAGLAVLYLQHKRAEEQTQVQALHAEVAKKAKEVEELQARQEHLERQRQELASQSDAIGAQLRARQRADTKAAALRSNSMPASVTGEETSDAGKGFGKMLSKMMGDPETKKFIRDQQRMMMNQLYAPLIKKMGLDADEAEKFKDLLADNMMKGAEKATSMFGGTSGTNRAALITSMNEEQKKAEEQVKAFLGDDRYALYQDYQLTVGERTQLNLFKQQTGDGPNALSEQQTEQLLGFMREEKQSAMSSLGSTMGGQNQANMEAMFSDEQASKLMEAQEAVNERVYERASQVLNPEQLACFGQFQTNQLQTMRMGMSMARKMFGTDSEASGTAAAK